MASGQERESRIHIALQEGFNDDDVIVRINGQEAYRRSGVTTRYQISYADSVEVDIEAGPAEIEVEVPSRATSVSQRLDAQHEVYLAVSLDRQGDITFGAPQTEPFRYA
jgi:hypothetical protein